MQEGGEAHKPLALNWGAVRSWWLLREEESIFLEPLKAFYMLTASVNQYFNITLKSLIFIKHFTIHKAFTEALQQPLDLQNWHAVFPSCGLENYDSAALHSGPPVTLPLPGDVVSEKEAGGLSGGFWFSFLFYRVFLHLLVYYFSYSFWVHFFLDVVESVNTVDILYQNTLTRKKNP